VSAQALALLVDPDTVAAMRQVVQILSTNDPSTNIACHVDAARAMNQTLVAVMQQVHGQGWNEETALEVVINKASRC
jgi:hypothetical protein